MRFAGDEKRGTEVKLALVNINTCGKASRQNLLSLSAEQSSVNYNHSHCVFAKNSHCFSFLLLAGSFCLPGGVKLKLDLPTVP